MAKVLLRLTDENKELLEVLSKHNKRSLNSEILVAIDRYIDENQLLINKNKGE